MKLFDYSVLFLGYFGFAIVLSAAIYKAKQLLRERELVVIIFCSIFGKAEKART